MTPKTKNSKDKQIE